MSEPITTSSGCGCGCGGERGWMERAAAPVVTQPVAPGHEDGVVRQDASDTSLTPAPVASGKPGNDLGLRAVASARAEHGHGGCGCGHGRGHGHGGGQGGCGCGAH